MTQAYKFGLAILGAGTFLATPAMAQDAVPFSGPYISAAVGISFQSDDKNDTLVFDTDRDGVFDDKVNTNVPSDAFGPGFCNGSATGTAPGCDDDGDKVSYAGRVGYDFRSAGSNVVVGGLFEVSAEDGKDSTSGFSTTPASYTLTRDIDYALSLRARAGFVLGDSALVYATGGASYARINHAFNTSNGLNSFSGVDNDKMQWGYQAGGGVEFMVTDALSIGLEYLYHNYKDDDYYVEVGPGTAGPTNPFLLVSGGTNIQSSNNFDFHTVRASVGFHF